MNDNYDGNPITYKKGSPFVQGTSDSTSERTNTQAENNGIYQLTNNVINAVNNITAQSNQFNM
ncbi:MAG: hypothetical protein HDT22_05030 [Ruminococcus sp.]|nr:hypothetical protein [Ruminococcus sp.]